MQPPRNSGLCRGQRASPPQQTASIEGNGISDWYWKYSVNTVFVSRFSEHTSAKLLHNTVASDFAEAIISYL